MNCPNCGGPIPEGATFCGYCGTTVQPQQPPYQQPQYRQQPPQQPYPPQYQQPYQPAYQQPPYQQPQYQPPVPRVTLTRKEFLARATGPVKTKSTLVLVTMLIAIALLLVSLILPIAGPITGIPVLSTAVALAGEDMNELMELLRDEVDMLEEDLETSGEYMEDDELEAAEKLIDDLKVLSKSPSLLNTLKLTSTLRDDCLEYFDESDAEVFEKLPMVVGIVIASLAAMFALPLLFTLLGGLKKSAGWTVAAMILSLGPQMLLSSVFIGLGTLAVFIVQIVLCSQVKKAYEIGKYRVA